MKVTVNHDGDDEYDIEVSMDEKGMQRSRVCVRERERERERERRREVGFNVEGGS